MFRCSLRGALRVLALMCTVIGAVLVFPSGAFAASGTINSVSIVNAPWGGMSMSATVTVDQADCPVNGACDWGLYETAAPISVGCTTFNSSQMSGESSLLTGAGTFDETLPMNLAPVGTDQVCLFIDGPANPGSGTTTLLASTSMTVPAPSGSISVSSQNDGQLGGVVSMSEPGCGGLKLLLVGGRDRTRRDSTMSHDPICDAGLEQRDHRYCRLEILAVRLHARHLDRVTPRLLVQPSEAVARKRWLFLPATRRHPNRRNRSRSVRRGGPGSIATRAAEA